MAYPKTVVASSVTWTAGSSTTVQCGEWGSHGVGVFLRRGQLGVWYCAEHKPKT